MVRVKAAVGPFWLACLALVLTLAIALSFASHTLAAEAPEGLGGMVSRIARMHARGPVLWARYVATTADDAARLLGKSRDQLSEGTPDRVYLVVMRGDFSLRDVEEGRGPYLAFLYWRRGETWNAADFTVLQHPVPMRSVGVPHAIETFALVHPTLDRAFESAIAGAVYFLAPILLVAAAALCVWRRQARWPYVLATTVAVAVAAWQTCLVVLSMAGRSWDPVFHGVKLATLAVVVCVDLAAALVVLRARASVQAAGRAGGGPRARSRAGLLLLVAAAALYVVSFPWLATTGE